MTSFFSSLMGLPSFFSRRARMASRRSMEKPIHSFFSLMNAKGMVVPRVRAVRVPVRLIFSRPVSARRGAGAPSSRAPASHGVTQRFIGGPPRGSRDDLIRSGKERLGNRESEGIRGLEVDDQLELCWLRYREIGGLGPFQDLADVHGGTTEHVRYARPVGHQASGIH